MTKVQEQLIQLLKVALGGEDSLAAEGINWMQLLDEAAKQGVKGLIWSCVQSHPEIAAMLSIEEKMEWFGQVRACESELQGKLDIINEFADLMQPLQFVALKGVDYARYWPSEKMREFGDLDCYFLGMGKDADTLALERGCTYEEGDYKHSHLFYKGLMIENHHYFTGFAGGKQKRNLELSLQAFIKEGSVVIGENKFLSPNVNFTASFMAAHACNHFFYEGMTLRHILDWLFFLQKEQDNVDWAHVYDAMDKAGIRKFADLITLYCKEYFGGSPTNSAITMSNDKAFLEAFNDDIFSDQMDDHDRRWYMMIARMVHRFRRHWRFRKIARVRIWRTIWNTVVYSDYWHRKPTLE